VPTRIGLYGRRALRLDAGKAEDAERGAGLRCGRTNIDLRLCDNANDIPGKVGEGEES